MAPLYHALRGLQHQFDVKVCVTAQHREMLDQVLEVFDIVPDIDLNLMRKGQDLFDVTSSVLLGMRSVIATEHPDLLLVHGDTTTSMAAALAGFYSGTPVGHVEAGLRTFNVQSPFPEEFNRQVTSKIARWHFAPTPEARNNLVAEGIPEHAIQVTGNTVIDALQWTLDRLHSSPERMERVASVLGACLPFDCTQQDFVLITGHRRENFGEGFLQIGQALHDLAVRYPQIAFVYPVHLNPNVQEPVIAALAGLANVHLISPLGYEPFVHLLRHCLLVLTDSGGIQEEAPGLGKPVVLMRDTTERPEAVQAGTVWMVGADRHKIVDAVSMLIDSPSRYQAMAHAHNPYGDGHACAAITNMLQRIL